MTDEELWLRYAREGCQRSVAALHGRYFAPLHAWIRRCGVRDEAEAADLFQDVWVRLVRNRERFDPGMKWTTWAFHVARNIARNEGRRLQRRRVTPEADFGAEAEESVQVGAAAAGTLPDEMMRERELGDELRRVLGTLPEDQRAMFTLRFVQGRSNEEVSEITGLPLGAVKARAKRVRLKVLLAMQAALEEDG